MIILINAKEAFHIIQHPFMIKTLRKRTEELPQLDKDYLTHNDVLNIIDE